MDTEATVKHKFLQDSNMTFEQVFDFAFKSLIPILQGLAKELGRTLFRSSQEGCFRMRM